MRPPPGLLPLLLPAALAMTAGPAAARDGSPGLPVVDPASPALVARAASLGLTASATADGGLSLGFNRTAWRGLVLRYPEEFSATRWDKWTTLVVDLGNPGSRDVKASVALRDEPDTWAEGRAAAFSAVVPAGGRAAWRIPLLHLRYTQGWVWPRQPGLGDLTGWGRLDTAGVREIWIGVDDEPADGRLVLHALRLEGPVAATGWIDAFGQRADLDWPTKIHRAGDLRAADARESADLRHPPAFPELDEYRAWKSGPLRPATGFFRVEQVDGRWWFVAPNGRLFFMTGPDVVGNWIFARIDPVVLAAYAWVPPARGAFADAVKTGDGGANGITGLSFYRANLIRKWGPAYEARFRTRAVDRLRAWGFTSIGNWSDSGVTDRRRLPYVTTGPDTGTLTVPFAADKIHDVFEPAFADQAVAAAAGLARYRDDPWCLGHFVENEVGWADFPRRLLSQSVTGAARRRWVGDLQARYGTIAVLARAWGVSASSFDELRWPKNEARLTATAFRDAAAFRGEFADRWYRIWADAVRRADPHHLVLGSRLHQGNRPDEVIAACARAMDVVSFNHYDVETTREEFDRYQQIANKPFLIGEYGFYSLDSGLLTAAVPVANEAERGVGYRWYTEHLAALPYFVGGHWFQYVDEPETGRFDRETAFPGLVSVGDVPYPDLVEAIRTTATRIYGLHAGRLQPVDRRPAR